LFCRKCLIFLRSSTRFRSATSLSFRKSGSYEAFIASLRLMGLGTLRLAFLMRSLSAVMFLPSCLAARRRVEVEFGAVKREPSRPCSSLASWCSPCGVHMCVCVCVCCYSRCIHTHKHTVKHTYIHTHSAAYAHTHTRTYLDHQLCFDFAFLGDLGVDCDVERINEPERVVGVFQRLLCVYACVYACVCDINTYHTHTW
jgi:hypothetical protein